MVVGLVEVPVIERPTEGSVSFSATLTRDAYDAVLARLGPLSAEVTVIRVFHADPNFRHPPATWRAILRQMWAVFVWEFKGAAAMKRPGDSMVTLTVPRANFSVSVLR